MSGKASRSAATGQSQSDGPDGAPSIEPVEPVDVAASYEHARDELAEVVAKLETGGLSLDESLELWERGERLAKQCTALLDGARERVDAVLSMAPDAAAD